jgi:hypothetical protein
MASHWCRVPDFLSCWGTHLYRSAPCARKLGRGCGCGICAHQVPGRCSPDALAATARPCPSGASRLSPGAAPTARACDRRRRRGHQGESRRPARLHKGRTRHVVALRAEQGRAKDDRFWYRLSMSHTRALYGSRTHHFSHDSSHPCGTSDAAGMAVGNDHLGGACPTGPGLSYSWPMGSPSPTWPPWSASAGTLDIIGFNWYQLSSANRKRATGDDRRHADCASRRRSPSPDPKRPLSSAATRL